MRSNKREHPYSLADLTSAILPAPQWVSSTAGNYSGPLPPRSALFAARIGTALPPPVRDAGILEGKTSTTEAFRIHITPEQIEVSSAGAPGYLYAQHTLAQLLDAGSPRDSNTVSLPCGVIEDRPALSDRGYMLDVSRNRVPTRKTMIELIDLLMVLRYNHLELYFEDVFAYPGHEKVWQETGTITPEDIEFLDAECRARGIELVPNQNSFGHLTGWLSKPEYRHLAEAPDGFSDPWGSHRPYPFSLSPAVDEVEGFLDELYTDLLPHFTSRRFNVGLDETFDLGQGRSASLIAELASRDPSSTAQHNAIGRVYLDMLQRVHRLVVASGRTMYFWSDIIQNHPDLISELPPSVVAIEWGYEADHDFDSRCRRLQEAGIPFLTAPGTSIWNSIGGRLGNADENIANAVEATVRYDGRGILLTDWGDNGHVPPPRLSRPLIVLAAARSWNPSATTTVDTAVQWTISYEAEAFSEADQTTLAAVFKTVSNLDFLSRTGVIHNASILGVALFTFGVPAHAPHLRDVQTQAVSEIESHLIEARRKLRDVPATTLAAENRFLDALKFSVDLGLFGLDILRLHRRHAGLTGAEDESSTHLADRARVALGQLDEQLVIDWNREYRPGGLARSRTALAQAAVFLDLIAERNSQ